jgi:hypothetical protein
MLAARGNVENRQAILKIGIRPLVPVAPDVSPSQVPLKLPIREYRALIDTGAQRTCLTRETIAKERLTSHGKRPIQNVHDTNIHYLFWVHMGFWCEGDTALGPQDTHRTYYGLPAPVEVIDIASNYWFDALIGMDVLGRYDLRLGRDGRFELSFT